MRASLVLWRVSPRVNSSIQLPLDPRYEVSGLIVQKCKFMDSKKVPLWLVFKNAEEGRPRGNWLARESDAPSQGRRR